MTSYASCPPQHITTPDSVANVLQLTDLHLFPDPDKMVAGVNCHDNFERCLSQAFSEDVRCDLIVVTGDLVNEVKTEIYDHIFARLDATGIPYVCIAGNHDVTDEIGEDLPFEQRKFVAHAPDTRLLSDFRVQLNHWQLLLLDSSVVGEVGGRLSSESLTWIEQRLKNHDDPTVLALHHHVVPMQSEWIDNHLIANSEQFWQTIQPFSHVKSVISGHVHQEFAYKQDDIQIYATPSTCYQFEPQQDEFGYDKDAKAGYRWLKLEANGELSSRVVRLAEVSASASV